MRTRACARIRAVLLVWLARFQASLADKSDDEQHVAWLAEVYYVTEKGPASTLAGLLPLAGESDDEQPGARLAEGCRALRGLDAEEDGARVSLRKDRNQRRAKDVSVCGVCGGCVRVCGEGVAVGGRCACGVGSQHACTWSRQSHVRLSNSVIRLTVSRKTQLYYPPFVRFLLCRTGYE